MKNEFSETMSKRTDEELIGIVTINKSSYQPEAILAAEEEIRTRGLNLTEIETMKSALTDQYRKTEIIEAIQAGRAARFLHYIIDSCTIIVLTTVVAFIIRMIFDITDLDSLESIWYGVLAIIFFGYYIIAELKYQKTLGKLITKTIVITHNGNRLTLKGAIIRTFCRFIPFDRISYLLSKNGFHDRLSDTIVVKQDRL